MNSKNKVNKIKIEAKLESLPPPSRSTKKKPAGPWANVADDPCSTALFRDCVDSETANETFVIVIKWPLFMTYKMDRDRSI